MVPQILKSAKIDDVVMMDEVATIRMCHELVKRSRSSLFSRIEANGMAIPFIMKSGAQFY